MKYFIDRANINAYKATSGKPPCNNAKLFKKYKMVGKYEKPNTYFHIWYIDINNIDDLWKLIKEVGTVIIEPRRSDHTFNCGKYGDKRRKIPEWPRILIYDSWIE